MIFYKVNVNGYFAITTISEAVSGGDNGFFADPQPICRRSPRRERERGVVVEGSHMP